VLAGAQSCWPVRRWTSCCAPATGTRSDLGQQPTPRPTARARPVLAEGLAQRLEVGLRIAGRPIGAGLVEQRLGAQEAGIGPKSHDLPLMWKPLASWASGPKGGPGRARHDDAALGRAHLEEADRQEGRSAQARRRDLSPLGSGGQDPIGQRLVDRLSEQPSVEVVGVVDHVMHATPDAPPMEFQMYYALDQLPSAAEAHLDNMGIVVHRSGDPHTVVPQLRAALTKLDPNLPLHSATTFTEARADLRWPTADAGRRPGDVLSASCKVGACACACAGATSRSMAADWARHRSCGVGGAAKQRIDVDVRTPRRGA